MLLSIRTTAFLVAAGLAVPSFAADYDWKEVGQALGKEGTMQPGDVYKVSLPRSDLRVTVEGIAIKPALALGSWVAFKPMGNGKAMAMGDLVLTQDEVNPVMAKLEAGGIQVTALHNHLLKESPFTMYLHVFGQGDPVAMAKTIHVALEESKTPFQTAASGSKAQSGSSSPAQKLDLDTAALDNIIGAKGKANGGVYQYSIPRADKITDNGMEVPPSMGTAISFGFQPTGGGKAAIAGDLVLEAKEVNPTIRALRENGIEVEALHNHMLTDQPRLFFVHVWANDDARKLAKGLRAALDKVNVKKG